jgi:hypothetical protein
VREYLGLDVFSPDRAIRIDKQYIFAFRQPKDPNKQIKSRGIYGVENEEENDKGRNQHDEWEGADTY